MKFSTSILGATALLTSTVSAFPAAALEHAARAEFDPVARAEIERAVAHYKSRRATPGFNATAQYVSNQGAHAFVAPNLATDRRGPCPGLNAMANHGYLPHNGVATIDQFTSATEKVFGMASGLGGFLSQYGALFSGDLKSWSIGGPDPSVTILGLSPPPGGMSGSHNNYEADVSPTRGDLYQYGNDYKLVVSQFQELFSMQPDPATANYNLDVLNTFRAKRFQQSIDNNPYFFNGPFSGVVVQPAAYQFIYRFMANKSAEHPEGLLNQEVLKSFFAITGKSGNFIYTEGHEKIPNNWYKRAIGDEYDLTHGFLTDLLEAALAHPEFLSIGGNTGTVNSFAGVDLKNLTGGLFSTLSLLQGDNLPCFIAQITQGAEKGLVAGLLSGVVGLLTGLLDPLLGGIVGDLVNGLTCPKLVNPNYDQFKQFPGAKGLYGMKK